MKEVVFFFLFFCLTVNCIAAEKVYTDADLKPKSPIYSESSVLAIPQPYRQSRGFYEQGHPIFQHDFKINSYSAPNKAVGTVRPVNPYMVTSGPMFGSSLTEAYARFTLFILVTAGILFLLWLFCLVDVLRNEFTGNNKIIWFLLVLFLPVLGAILYFFIGTDQKIQPEDDEEPVVRLI